jgi:hypothetical protein
MMCVLDFLLRFSLSRSFDRRIGMLILSDSRSLDSTTAFVRIAPRNGTVPSLTVHPARSLTGIYISEIIFCENSIKPILVEFSASHDVQTGSSANLASCEVRSYVQCIKSIRKCQTVVQIVFQGFSRRSSQVVLLKYLSYCMIQVSKGRLKWPT